jgi:Cof subfamily protein (haloacid dehalogenase superfamily)
MLSEVQARVSAKSFDESAQPARSSRPARPAAAAGNTAPPRRHPTPHPYKLVAIDLDGTLLCPRGRVTDRVRSALHAASDAGLIVCLATGRNPTESRAVLKALAYEQIGVFAGGALVYDCGSSRCLRKTHLPANIAAIVCDIIEQAGHAALALQDFDAAGVDYLVTQDIPQHASTDFWLAATQCAARPAGRLARAAHEYTIRVGMAAPRDQAHAVQQLIRDRLGDQVYCHAIDVQMASVTVLEVFHATVNKWQAIRHVAAEHNISDHEIAAVGDGVNDLHMLRSAGLGVAMGNAPPIVQQAAHRIIATNADDGLAEFLEELTEQMPRR